jgi:hypothetical protein
LVARVCGATVGVGAYDCIYSVVSVVDTGNHGLLAEKSVLLDDLQVNET